MQKKYGGVRRTCQVLFLITTLLIGYQFYQFVHPLEQGMIPDVLRPPGVEAFLPISALVSLKYFALTHVINEVHPSGLLILCFVLLSALVVKKSFCSWVCPIGFVPEMFTRVHYWLFKKGFGVTPWLDVVLRGLKYCLLGFFLFAILYRMGPAALDHCWHGDPDFFGRIFSGEGGRLLA